MKSFKEFRQDRIVVCFGNKDNVSILKKYKVDNAVEIDQHSNDMLRRLKIGDFFISCNYDKFISINDDVFLSGNIETDKIMNVPKDASLYVMIDEDDINSFYVKDFNNVDKKVKKTLKLIVKNGLDLKYNIVPFPYSRGNKLFKKILKYALIGGAVLYGYNRYKR